MKIGGQQAEEHAERERFQAIAGQASVLLCHLVPITATADWTSQRRRWRELRRLTSRRI
jgi:hypothetical protein